VVEKPDLSLFSKTQKFCQDEMHSYAIFPVLCLTWFTVLYLVRLIILAKNVETRVQFLAVNLSLRTCSV